VECAFLSANIGKLAFLGGFGHSLWDNPDNMVMSILLTTKNWKQGFFQEGFCTAPSEKACRIGSNCVWCTRFRWW